jgi:heme/copper-type cytochrome/quinol oxidase subunit 2
MGAIVTAANSAASTAGGLDACLARYRQGVDPSAWIDSLDRLRSVCENILAGQYRLETLETGQRIYAHQIFQTTVIMWMVVTITLSGVLLAGLQLWASYRLALAGQGALADGGEATIHQNRLVVRSSVVGVIILALSFAFFTVYVLYVYRISDLPGVETVAPPIRAVQDAQEVPR